MNLGCANLSGAILRGAILRKAGVGWTNLSGADLSGSTFGRTLFASVDLSGVIGLDHENIRHGDPSTVGINTIYRSGAKIPKVFLRRAGVPEDLIVYMRSLVANPLQFYACFTSYSTKD